MKNFLKKIIRSLGIVACYVGLTVPVYSMFDVHYFENKQEKKYLCLILLAHDTNATCIENICGTTLSAHFNDQNTNVYWSFFTSGRSKQVRDHVHTHR